VCIGAGARATGGKEVDERSLLMRKKSERKREEERSIRLRKLS